jgi:CheY-like chemotaxis protein
VLHSEGSEVRIDIERTKLGSWILRISDNGVGIPSGVIERVMLGGLASEAGTRVLTANSDSNNRGWGIGLSGCRAILRRHGGDLVILSPNVGSLIEVALPGCVVTPKPLKESCGINAITRAGADERSCGSLDTASERRIIIVDDDSEHATSLARILERRGVKADIYDRVDSALKACVSGSAGEVSEAVVCDAQMPDGGAERLLKLLSTSGVRVKFAVMSGESSDSALYRFAALGAREFFAKPLDIERVIAWL